MNRVCVLLVCFSLLLAQMTAEAQSEQLPELCLTTTKTTVIISHFKIRSVDRGSRDILVQKVAGVDTILELKAGRINFPETNLTIVTGDGLVHMFLVHFNAVPPVLKYFLAVGNSDPANSECTGNGGELTEAEYERISDSILAQPAGHWGRSARSCGAKAMVAGIYIHDGNLFFRFRLQNRSNIGYGIDQINFYIRDKDQAKRTASQDLAEVPLFFRGGHSYIKGKAAANFVAGFDKFTIPGKKVLYLIIKEKDGGRLLRLRITNRELLKARLI
jgi:conjugative transposon TraN protein